MRLEPPRPSRFIVLGIALGLLALASTLDAQPPRKRTMFVALSDSLGHGTMDGMNNALATRNAFVQLVAERLAEETSLFFNQPFYDERERRIAPFKIPTNLSVDGSDIFSLEGVEYYERVGAEVSFVSSSLLGNKTLPPLFDDDYDKVLYPLNLFARGPVSQLDGAIWLMNVAAPRIRADEIVVFFWMGNNDTSTAARGFGGANPEIQPIPLDEVAPELTPLLRLLLRLGERRGDVSFAPYTPESIERGMTNLDDFQAQYERVLSRLLAETSASGIPRHVFVGTLPYYSAIGYLLDSDDLEFYLRKVDPSYAVPPSFARVAPPGEPINDPLRGDRVSLLTFGFMLALLDSGYPADYVNRALELDGEQRDGLVLSEAEQGTIRDRIDAFNNVIRSLAAAAGPDVRVIETGPLLSDALSGAVDLVIAGRKFTRKWSRGGGLSLDGVHPGYTGQALIANRILEEIDGVRGTTTLPFDLDAIALQDPYVDWDGDGWVPGPDVEPFDVGEILFLLTDPDDTDPDVEAELPDDFWERLSDMLLGDILRIPGLRAEAERLGK